jgi:ribosomal protein S21
MLRKFSRLVIEEGIIDEVKERMYYRSPSVIKKEKRKELAKKKRSYRE